MTHWHKLELWVGTEEPLQQLDDFTGIQFAHDLGRAIAKAFDRDPLYLDAITMFATVVDPPLVPRRFKLQGGAIMRAPKP